MSVTTYTEEIAVGLDNHFSVFVSVLLLTPVIESHGRP